MFYEAPCVQRWMPLLTVLLIINTSHGEVDSPQSKQHAVTLPNGVVAEVVGVSTGTAKHRAWWAPNGKPLAEAPYEYRARQRVASDPRKYEIVVRVSGLDGASNVKGSFAGKAVYPGTVQAGDGRAKDLWAFDIEVEPEQETADLGVAAAANQWETTHTFTGVGTYGEGKDRLTVKEPDPVSARQTPGILFRASTMSQRFLEDAFRLIAIDVDGREHVSKGSQSWGQEHTLEASFPELPRERIKEFRRQRCAFASGTIKGIALRPNGDAAALAAARRVKRLLAMEAAAKPGPRRIDEAVERLRWVNVDKVDEWAPALRELAEIGPVATPVLLHELQVTSRPYTRSALAFALRAIDDPRTVPGLARALADCPFGSSDYGATVPKDAAVATFLLRHQRDSMNMTGVFSFGRPVNEITYALKSITDHDEGNQHQLNNQRELFQKASENWLAWWEQEGAKLLEGLPEVHTAVRREGQPVRPNVVPRAKLEALLRERREVADEAVAGDWRRLHFAAMRGNHLEARLLLDHGATIDALGSMGWAPLHLAAALGHMDTVELLLNRGADIAAKTDAGLSVLHVAAGAPYAPLYGQQAPRVEMVKFLLARGADVKARDAFGRTALHYAATQERAAFVEALLDAGAEVDAKDDRGRTALHRACECNREEVALMLVARGADINARDGTDRGPMNFLSFNLYDPAQKPPLLQAFLNLGANVDFTTVVALGDARQVELAIRQDPAVINQKTKSYYELTPLHWAVQRKDAELVALLLKHGADPNGKDKHGDSPIRGAVQGRQERIVEMLIAAGLDVNAKLMDKTSALYWAAGNLDLPMVQRLLDAGADPNLLNDERNASTPLGTACSAAKEKGMELARPVIELLLEKKADPNGGRYPPILWANEEIGKLLLAHGARLDVTTEEGEGPMHFAATAKDEGQLRFLLELKMGLEPRNKRGETPLHRGAMWGQNVKVLEALIAAGADTGARDEQGLTPLHHAVQRRRADAVEALVKGGADVNAKDRDGATPLHHAARLGADAVIPVLLKHGADVAAKDVNGQTPTEWAEREATKAVLRGGKVEPTTRKGASAT